MEGGKDLYTRHVALYRIIQVLRKYVIERNEVLFNVCIASCFQIRGPRESSYAHLLLRLGFSQLHRVLPTLSCLDGIIQTGEKSSIS